MQFFFIVFLQGNSDVKCYTTEKKIKMQQIPPVHVLKQSKVDADVKDCKND